MNTLRVTLILVAAFIIVTLWSQIRTAREALIATQVQNQFGRIKERGLAFYQLKLDRKVLDHSFKGGGKLFELRIVIPKENERDFKEWIQNVGFDVPALRGRNQSYSGGGEENGELFWKFEYE